MCDSKIVMFIVSILNRLAMRTAVSSANASCDWIFFQDEQPDEVTQLRKF